MIAIRCYTVAQPLVARIATRVIISPLLNGVLPRVEAVILLRALSVSGKRPRNEDSLLVWNRMQNAPSAINLGAATMTRFASLLLAAFLAACGGSGDKPSIAVSAPTTPEQSGAPTALAPKRTSSQSVIMPVNADDVAKAVDRLRITKKKGESSYEHVGADLNSDGHAEAVVLFTGQDWCSPQGCTLAIFKSEDVGLRPVSQITGVRGPVAVSPNANGGWRDLIVKTGTGKVVRLQFSAGGYPSIASTQPEAGSDLANAELLIQAPGGSAVAAASTSAIKQP